MVQKSGKLTSYKLVVHPTISPGLFTHPNGGWPWVFLNHPTVTSREGSQTLPGSIRDLKLQSFTGWKGNPQRGYKTDDIGKDFVGHKTCQTFKGCFFQW